MASSRGRELFLRWGIAAPSGAWLQAAPPYSPQMSEPGQLCCSCGTCGLFVGLLVAIPLLLIALNAGLAVWVARDAGARSVEHRRTWIILILVSGPFGWLVFLLTRPRGRLVTCPGCEKKRLEASARCPHCGQS